MKLYLLFAIGIITIMYWGGMAGDLQEGMCESAESSPTLSGLEMFFFCNFNIFVFVVNLIAIVGVLSL